MPRRTSEPSGKAREAGKWYKGLGETLLWPLKDKETQRTLDVIRAQKGTCDLALSIDNT
jgi:hypothetical protein